MKKFITTALTLCILTAAASAQLLDGNKTKKDVPFSQWKIGAESTFFSNWQKQYEEAKAKQAREKAAVDKAYAAIPEKAKTKAEIKWHEFYTSQYGEEGSLWGKYTCSVILLDYNEKNGFGTVNAAFKNDCFKLAKEKSEQHWFTFSIFLYKFNSEYQEESFIYEYDSSVDTNNLKPFSRVKINGYDYYQFYMPVRTPALQAGLRKLFPGKKNFITAEKAALALKKMPAHSKLTFYSYNY